MSHQLKQKAEFIDRNSNLLRNYGTNPIPSLTDQDNTRMKISILQHHVDYHALQVQSEAVLQAPMKLRIRPDAQNQAGRNRPTDPVES
jgi:hypothetical protein